MKQVRGQSRLEKSSMLKVVLALAIVLLAVFVLFMLLFQSSHEETVSPDTTDNSFLSCENSAAQDLVFSDEQTPMLTYNLQAIFTKEALLEITLEATATLHGEGNAEQLSTRLHADFNHYLTKHNYSVNAVESVFSDFDNTVKMHLAAEGNELDQVTAPLFFMNSDTAAEQSRILTREKVESQLKERGFICKSNQSS